MWLFPYLTWAVIVFIVGALTVMLFSEAHRMEIMATGLLALIVVAIGNLVGKRHAAANRVPAAVVQGR